MRTNRRVQTEENIVLYPEKWVAPNRYPRQYCAYTTWWIDGKYDGSIMLRVIL